MPWACQQCNFLISLSCTFDRFNATAERNPMKFLRFFGPFFIQMGHKVDFTPGTIRILLCCFEKWEFNECVDNLFRRTLESDKNWLRYSSFSVISLVKLPILRAWNFLEQFKTLKRTLAKHDNVSKKTKNFEIRNGMTCRGCASQKCSNPIKNVKIFLRNMLEKSPQYRHFTHEMAVSENVVLLFLTRFLVGPLPVLESP